jgi:hypothetical protein
LNGHQPLGLLGRQVETGVTHAQRLEQPLAQEFIKGRNQAFIDEVREWVPRCG